MLKIINHHKGLILPLFSAILISACTENGDLSGGSKPAGEDTLICLIDESQSETGDTLSTDAQSKSSLSQNYIPVWTAGDEISVFTIEGEHGRFQLVDGQGTAKGTFKGKLPDSDNYYTIYPYSDNNSITGNQLMFSRPQIQAGTAGDFPLEGSTMVASFSKDNLTPAFKNVFGLLQINLSGTAKVGKITITSKDENEMLWGNFSLTMDGNVGTDSQNLSVSDGSNETSLCFVSPVQLSEGSASPFYFVLPSGALSSGFTVDIYDESNNLVFTQSTAKNQQIIRSGIRGMSKLEDVNRIIGSDVIPDPFSWAAYSNLGRTGTADNTVIDPQTSGYPHMKQNKYVGIFYFIWHTANSAGGGPYDVQKSLGAGNYNFVDVLDYDCGGGKTHHWGEPYLGYYRDDDLWVLRKHAQMLADAGVDFIAFDVTNDTFYESEITKLCNLYVQMRSEGYKTPQITFMIWHSGKDHKATSIYEEFDHDWAVTHLYNTFYTKAEYSDLWFKWEGKPLMMALGSHVKTASIRNYFTFRPTWYLWNNHAQTQADIGDKWYYENGGPNDKWPWAVAYTDDTNNPMRAGTHNGTNEFCPVSPATHPVSNIGRSYPINQGIDYNSGANSYTKQPALGVYFKSQFTAANALDPQIMFFTGWNEFLMGHFAPGVLEFYWCGGMRAYNSMFVDQYNNEFSRDIEPIAGDYGDNYYYYMADYIRKFKGVSSLPVYSKYFTITIDGKFADWNNVGSCYADDKYDNKWRGYDSNGGNNGWQAYGNTLPNYVNKTGRNDLRICKVATDGTDVSFYIESADNLTGYDIANTGLKLLITSGDASKWEGFNYLVEPTSSTKATLNVTTGGGYSWTPVSTDIAIAVNGNKMEVSIPISLIGINNSDSFSLDFKWVDNVDLSGQDGIQRCMKDGDSAPNGRFRYRYIFNK